MPPSTSLRLVKAFHTLVWAVFAGCILAIPASTARGRLTVSTGLIAFVALEVAVLAFNRMRCPLTDVAAHDTEDRRDNFDIHLPLWLARHNKAVFGGLYVAGVLYTLWAWAAGRGGA